MNHFENGGMAAGQSGPNGGSVQFLSPDKMNQMADYYLSAADQLVKDYSILGTDIYPQKSPAYDDYGDAIE